MLTLESLFAQQLYVSPKAGIAMLSERHAAEAWQHGGSCQLMAQELEEAITQSRRDQLDGSLLCRRLILLVL